MSTSISTNKSEALVCNDSIEIFILNAVRVDLQNEWFLQKNNQRDKAIIIKEKFRQLIDNEYQSQQMCKLGSINRILKNQGDIQITIEDALKLHYSEGNSFLAQFIHCNSMFKACLDYTSSGHYNNILSLLTDTQIQQKLSIILSSIDKKLSSVDFQSGFEKENPNILAALDSLEKQKQNDNNIIITHKRKPRYLIWTFVGVVMIGTTIGLYLKKK